MSRNRKARIRRRNSLWCEQEGLCFYCKRVMLHPNDLKADPGKHAKYGVKFKPDGRLQMRKNPLNLATIDHLRDRFHPERRVEPINQEQRLVLACWECNTNRGNASQAAQPIEVLHERAQRHGLRAA